MLVCLALQTVAKYFELEMCFDDYASGRTDKPTDRQMHGRTTRLHNASGGIKICFVA